MRKAILAIASVSALVTLPHLALAQDGTAAGVATGAAAGAIVGGPVGAAVGAGVGGVVGGIAEQNARQNQPVVVVPGQEVTTGSVTTQQRTCVDNGVTVTCTDVRQ